MFKESKIDYLQFNIKELPEAAHDFEEIPPIRNYKKGLKAPNLSRYYFGNVNSDKWLCIMSGQAMEVLRSEVTEKEYLSSIIEQGANVTRLDMAIDCFVGDDLITVDDMAYWFQNDKIESKHVKYGAKTIGSLTESGQSMETLYIGDTKKRGKLGIFRAYEKGIELDIGKYMITRFELEEKRESAMTTARRLVDNSLESVFRSRFDVKDQRWIDFMDAPQLDITRGKAITDNEVDSESKWSWLIMQVAPTLGREVAREAMETGNRVNFDHFNKAVEQAYNQFITENYTNKCYDHDVD